MSDIQPVLCAKCRVPIKGPAKPDPDSVLSCPVCGESDTFDNIKGELAQQAKEHLAKHFQAAMGKAARGSKSLKYTPGAIPKRTYRFVVDLESH